MARLTVVQPPPSRSCRIVVVRVWLISALERLALWTAPRMRLPIDSLAMNRMLRVLRFSSVPSNFEPKARCGSP